MTQAGVGRLGSVYDIQCPECKQNYIGEPARILGTIIILSPTLSAISKHKLNTGHQCSMKDVKILGHEENWHRRKIKEAINIHREKPTQNRDVGQELPPVLLQLVSMHFTLASSTPLYRPYIFFETFLLFDYLPTSLRRSVSTIPTVSRYRFLHLLYKAKKQCFTSNLVSYLGFRKVEAIKERA